MATLSLIPISLADAKAFTAEHHRHHLPSHKWKFGVGVQQEERLIGVIVVGRPVNRNLDDGWTLEVTRCCTLSIKNANSMLYGAARRAAKALGYKKLITYILESEDGVSLRASGFRFVTTIRAHSWDTPSRRRTGEYLMIDKQRWEMEL